MAFNGLLDFLPIFSKIRNFYFYSLNEKMQTDTESIPVRSIFTILKRSLEICLGTTSISSISVVLVT
jgi:hypothetical protein